MRLLKLPQRFRTKLMIMVVLVSGVPITLLGVSLVLSYAAQEDRQLQERALVLATVLADQLGEPLAAHDVEAASATLVAEAGVPHMSAAALRLPDDTTAARYVRPGYDESLLRHGNTEGIYDTDRHVVVVVAVNHMGKRLGTLTVAYSRGEVDKEVRRRAMVIALSSVCAFAGCVTLGLLLLRNITQPIGALIATAEHVRQTGDYHDRAQRYADDELGELTDEFNGMLEKIAGYDASQREAMAELSRTADALAASNVQLEQKRHEMQELMNAVTHDLKSPIVTCQGFARLLAADLEANRRDRVDSSLEQMRLSLSRMKRDVDRLLEYSRVGATPCRLAPVDLGALARNIVTTMNQRFDDAGASAVFDGDLPTVTGDDALLSNVIENLLTNALKYGCTTPDRRVHLGATHVDGETRVYIKDHGPGIDAEYHRKVFELFQRLASPAEGSGVGLAIVERVMQLHNGRAWVESTPGAGCTFWLGFRDGRKPGKSSKSASAG
ncbi:MAG: HAMP domain-containing protein [Phycisphaera sp.]|nr:HAMP domain-containing protein [Phycisphaera sp.]